ncbi:MAG: hypothetical protein HYZ38_01725 [Mycobacterium sp.]|jgi:hypothetical protein|nr:hypothetical protein [Mycobacterium sp.]
MTRTSIHGLGAVGDKHCAVMIVVPSPVSRPAAADPDTSAGRDDGRIIARS